MTKFILSDPQGVEYIRVPLLTPSRSGLTPLRRGATTNRTSPRSLVASLVQPFYIMNVT